MKKNKKSNLNQDAIIGGLQRKKFLGFSLKLKKMLNNKIYDFGFEIIKILNNSPADKAGLQKGDIIVLVNNQKIYEKEIFSEKIFDKDGKICLCVFRDNKYSLFEIKFEKLPLEKSNEFNLIYTSFISRNNRLRMIINLPNNTDKKTQTIFFLQGIGCNSIDFPFNSNHPYKKIADYFTKLGFIFIRIDKSGLGDSEGVNCKDINFYSEVEDFVMGVKFSKTLPFVNHNRISLFGYSIGGVIAPIVATKTQINSIIVFGTIASNYMTYLSKTIKIQHELKGETLGEINKYISNLESILNLLFIKKINTRKIIKMIPESTKFILDNKYIFNRHYTYFQELSKIQILKNWSKIKSPVLILAGVSDYVACYDEQVLLYNKLLEYGKIKKLTFLRQEIDHNFRCTNSVENSYKNIYTKKFCIETINLTSKWIYNLHKKNYQGEII